MTDSTENSANPQIHYRFSAKALKWIPLVLLIIAMIGRICFGFETDELQHLHFSWDMTQGMTPYKDFFEHHPPGLHTLIAPLVAGRHNLSFEFLLLIKALVVMLTCLSVILFGRLLRTELTPNGVVLGTIVWIVTPPFQIVALELRPDTLAIFLTLVCFVTIQLEKSSFDARKMFYPAILGAIGGLAAGYSSITTQKMWFIQAGVMLWVLVQMFVSRVEFRLPKLIYLVSYGLFFAGTIGMLVSRFQNAGALQDLISSVITQNLHWKPDFTLRHSLQEILLPAAPIFIIGTAEMIRQLSNREFLKSGSVTSLMSFVCLFGGIALLRTPSPTPQSVFTLVGPWIVYLAVTAFVRYSNDLSQLGADRNRLSLSTIFVLAGLYWYNALIVLVVFGSGFFAIYRLNRRKSPDLMASRLGTFAVVILAISFLIRTVGDIQSHKVVSKLAFAKFVESNLGPDDPVLQTWPLIAPFHKNPVFHGFAPYGILLNEPVDVMLSEYQAAVQKNPGLLVVANPDDFTKLMPKYPGILKTYDKLPAPNYPGDLFVFRSKTFEVK